MMLLILFFISATSFTGYTPAGTTTPFSDARGTGFFPEIEVLAPRYMEGKLDSLDMVQGITVYGSKEDNAVQNYRIYRRIFSTLSTLFFEYALYLIAGILMVTVGAIALAKIVKGSHVHLVHEHKHSRIHEYYVWRKSFLDKQQQEKLTRRT